MKGRNKVIVRILALGSEEKVGHVKGILQIPFLEFFVCPVDWCSG